MKFLVLSILTLFVSTSFADVKPEGALVPELCGENTLQGEGYPTMVCTGTPVGHNDGTAFFKLSFEGEKKDQYWVSYSFSVDYKRGVAIFSVVRALVKQVGDYVVMTGLKRHRGEKFELNPETLELSGPNFKAKLR